MRPKLPDWFQKLSVVGVFVIELVLPWFIFGPCVLRLIAFGGFTALMLLIGATGNYNFFNLLTIVLAVTLLDDRVWPQFLRRRLPKKDQPTGAVPKRWRNVFLVPFAGLAIVVGSLQVKEAILPAKQPRASLESDLHIAQFLLVNDYGLFRKMTETRPEIVIEGSTDGKSWQPYEFRWKPGDLSQAPRFCTPHQPRLDWQMWFEALRLEQVYQITGTVDPRNMSPWFQSFIRQLLKGEPSVVGLLKQNPFPGEPPKFIRIVLYQYRFTNSAERAATGDWWHRKQVWTGPGWSLPASSPSR